MHNNNNITTWAWVQRWLFSTNCKEIAILYIIFSVFAGLIGTALSLIIRMELAGPSPQILFHNGQLFNVVISAHAVMMIFFLVMPITMGFFANSKKNILYNNIEELPPQGRRPLEVSDNNSINKPSIQNDNHINESNNINKINLGPYLAGLIEGDGTIFINDNESRVKYTPKIDIVFKKADKPFAEYLSKLIGCGKVYDKEGEYVIWQNQRIVDVFIIINLINGHMRTPKHEALVRIINWYNNYITNNQHLWLPATQEILKKLYVITCKPIDTSPIDSNAWLAGFTDADGNFAISLSKKTSKHESRINLYYRLEIRQQYHKPIISDSFDDLNIDKRSYHNVMLNIASLFKVKLYSRSQRYTYKGINKIYNSYIVMVTNYKTLVNVPTYFDKYPLLSSKYLDYKDWCKVLDVILSKGQDTLPGGSWELGNHIRKDYNSTRSTFTWDHLNNCYLTK